MYAHAQAPVRIGIAGGGTDLPAWTKDRVGHCLSLAVKMYTHAVAIGRPDGAVVAAYRKRDVDRAATEIANGLIRESALLHDFEDSFEVHTLSELSSRGSGLGVSSSIAVALAACFRRMGILRDRARDVARWRDLRYQAMAGEPLVLSGEEGAFVVRDDPAYLLAVARDAWTVEIDRLRRPIGRQDHMAAAHGGLRLYAFRGDSAEVERSFSEDDARWVAEHLRLVRLPEGHDSRAILTSVRDAAALEEAAGAVSVAASAIERRDVQELGRALGAGQDSKMRIRGAVPSWLSEIVGRINAVDGVRGCKVAGAGGGGHLVVACDPGIVEAIECAARLPVLRIEADLRGVRSDGWV